jgi:hypothetical protein
MPSQISGQAKAPSKNQQKQAGKKKPKAVKAAQSVGDKVADAINKLNPFD